jgi:hypothetical protein
VTIGAGLQTSFVHTDVDKGTTSDRFLLNSARLYVNGPVMDKIKFMFNTEFEGATNKIGVLDAVARIEVNKKFNLWAGRMLPPSDRANLYGPYYAHHWNTFSDGVQNGHPSVLNGGSPTGRANGIVYWGDFAEDKVKFSLGAFDGPTLTGNKEILGAARLQFDFWDGESGYYLNGTYYGDKDLLSLAGASMVQDGNVASTVDFLMEKKVASGGVFSLEAEYANYNRLGGYVGGFKSQGGYGLAAFMFPKQVGVGKFEILGKYAKAQFTQGPSPSYQQKTTEINFNYVMKQFNARLMNFFKVNRYSNAIPDTWQVGAGLQVQM